jgi:integrase
VGCIYRLKKSRFYWIKYIGVDGIPQYESSRSEEYDVARDLLRRREGAIADGVPITAAAGRLRFRDAAADVERDFEVNDKATLDEVQRRYRLHLIPYFGRCRMAEIDTAMIRRYIAKRQADRIVTGETSRPVSNGEINRELALIKRAFRLAYKEGRLLYVPHVPMLKEAAPRKGFLDASQIQDVISILPAELRPVIQFTYITGWRMASEVLPLTWDHVDFDASEIRLDTSKNGEGRVFPMNEDLRTLLKAQQRERDRLRKAGHIVPWVFFRMVAEGRGGPQKPQPILSLGKAWRTACRKAGCPGRILHDLRRSGVRNMIRAGIPESVAMRLVGHKTRSMLDRYNIIDNRDLRDAAEKLDGVIGHRQS